ncbi:uncharacterized protein [Sinocyclocheilus grahami]|uniref:uncharacterized protein n=1 Tax=Sinocyclocheilus grahami TaxID=75366 RepID=UPI0007AC9A80|nr:PREDICTED: uncharacterized protein LOC107568442 [Sinocyclocheilus grahami]
MAAPVVGGLTGKFFVCVAVFAWLAHGFLGMDADNVSVSVVEGDSVTLLTNVNISQQERMKWYMNDIRIAQIIDSQRKICTDVQCEERFRGRLQLDHRTGSLTITDIRTTDSGLYQLLIISSSSIEEEFNVSVHGVSADERNQTKRTSVKEGGSVTLDPGVIKNPNDVMMWYFIGTLRNEIDGDPIKICEDVQCDERFRDRLKLDHQTGSLTITDTRTTDSGLYQLEISSHQCHGRCTVTSMENFHVEVIGSGRSSVVRGGIIGSVLMAAVAAVGLICYRFWIYRNDMEKNMKGWLLDENHV